MFIILDKNLILDLSGHKTKLHFCHFRTKDLTLYAKPTRDNISYQTTFSSFRTWYLIPDLPVQNSKDPLTILELQGKRHKSQYFKTNDAMKLWYFMTKYTTLYVSWKLHNCWYFMKKKYRDILWIYIYKGYTYNLDISKTNYIV